MVQLVEVDVTQQGADYRALRTARFRRVDRKGLNHALAEKQRDQRHYPCVADFAADPVHQPFVGDPIEVRFQIGIDNVALASLEQRIDATQGVFATATSAEAVALLGKVPFEDRFEPLFERRLHHRVANRWNAQRALLSAARLGDIRRMACRR